MLRRLRQITVVLLVLFALYVVLGFLLVPALLRSKALPLAQEKLVPTLEIERLSFNPLTLSLTAHGIQLSEANLPAHANIEELHVDLSAASLLRFHAVVSEIRLTQPQIHIARSADGSLNWADIAVPSTIDDEPEEVGREPTHFTLQEVTIIDGVVTIEDASLGESFTQQLGPLNFSLVDLSTQSETPGRHELTATTPEGGTLHWSGDIQLYPLVCNGELNFEGIALHRASPYLSTHLGWKSTSASVSWKLEYIVDMGGTAALIQIKDGNLELADLKLQKTGAPDSFFELERLQISDISTDIGGKSATVGRIELTGPLANASRSPDGTINLLALFPASEAGEPPNASETPEADAVKDPWKWSVGAIAIKNGTVNWSDAAVSPATSLALNLSEISLGPIESDLSKAFPIKLAAALENAGELTISGQLAPAPLSGEFTVNLIDFDPAAVGAYWSPSAGLDWNEGTVSAETQLVLSSAGNGSVAIKTTSDAQIKEIELVERTTGEVLAKGTLIQADAVVFEQAGQLLSIDRILLNGMHVNLQRDAEGVLNLPGGAPEEETEEIASSEPNESADPIVAEETPSEPSLQIKIAKVELTDNQFDFSDAGTNPAVAIRLEGFGGTIENIDSDPTARAEVDLRGKLQGVSTLSLTGTLNPFPETLFIDLKTKLEATDLTTFSPYSAQFLGRKIAKGKLSLDLAERIENHQLKGTNKLKLDQFKWGEKIDAPDAPSLPLDLAVTLFKDMNGVINIDLPLEGDMSAPGFSIGALIFQVFGNLMTKAVTSPFRFLAAAILPEGVDPSVVEFAPGRIDLPADHPTLGALGAIREARPLVHFELQGHFAESDVIQLRREQLEATLRKEWEALPADARPAFIAVRSSIIRKLAGGTPEEPLKALEAKLLATVEIAPEALINLAQKRGEAVQNALIVAGLPADALFLLEPMTEAGERSAVTIGLNQ